MSSKMKWCHTTKDIPTSPHYAILDQRSVHIPGDERSRTHPGHGYPASTEQVWDYIVFADRESWEEEIKSRQRSEWGRKDFIAISATPATINTTIQVEVK
jgi:hypothetical protein